MVLYWRRILTYERSTLSMLSSRQYCTIWMARCSGLVAMSWVLYIPCGLHPIVPSNIVSLVSVLCMPFGLSPSLTSFGCSHADDPARSLSSDPSSALKSVSSLPIHTPLSTALLNSLFRRLTSTAWSFLPQACAPHHVPGYRRFFLLCV